MSTTRSTHFAHSLLICAVLFYFPRSAFAQTTDSQNPGAPSKQTVVCGPAHLGRCLKDIALDQAGIWTSPLRLKSRDAFWLVPFAGATAVAIHYDTRALQELGTDQ